MQTNEARAARYALWMVKIRQEIESKFDKHCFTYVDFERAEVLLVMSAGFGGWVAVIGEPDQGSYEWVSQAEVTGDYSASDRGYGCMASALRDRLNEMLGPGDQVFLEDSNNEQ